MQEAIQLVIKKTQEEGYKNTKAIMEKIEVVQEQTRDIVKLHNQVMKIIEERKAKQTTQKGAEIQEEQVENASERNKESKDKEEISETTHEVIIRPKHRKLHPKLINERIRNQLIPSNIVHKSLKQIKGHAEGLQVLMTCPAEAIQLKQLINTTRLGLRAMLKLSTEKKLFVQTQARHITSMEVWQTIMDSLEDCTAGRRRHCVEVQRMGRLEGRWPFRIVRIESFRIVRTITSNF